MHYTDMYEMLRNMEPPVGFGKKCPYRLAYRVYHLLFLNSASIYSTKVNFGILGRPNQPLLVCTL